VRRRSATQVLAGGGETGALMRAIDWAQTPIGPVDNWSQALRATVGLLLRNRFPMLLWWGPKFVQLYNDAYRPIPGERHPRALGQSASECWREIWHIIGPMIEAPFRGGDATTSDNLTLLIHRKGILEETHFKVAYSPVPDETVPETGIGGVLATVAETTEQVYGERQLRTLRELGARAAGANTTEQACQRAADALRQNDRDVTFALVYLLDDTGEPASLGAQAGIDRAAHAGLAPVELALETPPERAWPLAEALAQGAPLVVERLHERFGEVPVSAWGKATQDALVIPLVSPEQPRAYGALVCGVSPHRALDPGYRTFFELAAAQVVTAIRNARAYQAERKRAEGLAQIDRAKTTFFSNVSHEFRTPLTLMLGPTEDLLAGIHGPLEPAQRTQLELVRRNQLRLRRLVNALLQFSRIEAGRIQARYQRVDLAALTRDLASTFRSAAERARLRLLVDCAPLDGEFYVDRELWERIVLNLLSNAFKFTFQGEIAVSLRPAGTGAVLEVRDTGVGVRAEDLPRLFERFHRIENVRARTHEGSGIGLALVQELTRLHGGSIAVDSKHGHGTEFRVTIPCGRAHLPPDRIAKPAAAETRALAEAPLFAEEALHWLPEPAEPEERPGAATSDLAAPGRILIADDNKDMREYLRRILAKEWTVRTAPDGEAALAIARAWQPDVLVSDVMMPGLDGFGLLRALRDDEALCQTPVIMLSARAGEESRIDGLQAGADDYLVKPFSARELCARVDTQLKLARARAQLTRSLLDTAHALHLSELLIAILGHDLRNPLSAIVTAAALLQARAGGERIGKPAGRIVVAADRMERMISQLLDFSRIRLGAGLPLEPAPCDAVELARTVVAELEIVHKRPLQLQSTGDVRGTWDRDRLLQLLSNLAGNACQHSAPDGPVRIAVNGTHSQEVRIEVVNQGAIPAAVAAAIFEPLHDVVRHKRRPGSSGLGLGLFITRQIALAHGGSIALDTGDERATRFLVTLPRHTRPSNAGGTGKIEPALARVFR
jgi:signal transduction histidine kinase